MWSLIRVEVNSRGEMAEWSRGGAIWDTTTNKHIGEVVWNWGWSLGLVGKKVIFLSEDFKDEGLMVKISQDNLAVRIDCKKADDNRSKEPDKG